MPGYIKRYPAPTEDRPDPRSDYSLDLIGLDSSYDYDPVWRRCVELGVAPTFHSGSQALGFRQSFSSYIFNHLGNFSAGIATASFALPPNLTAKSWRVALRM